MSSNFKIKITMLILFLIYASCTAFMVRIELIPLNMVILETLETFVIFIIIIIFFHKIESMNERKRK